MARASILVVDDNPQNAKMVAYLLTANGYAVRTAASVDEALAVLAHEVPPLILMDLQLPGMDGLTLTRLLKADPRTRDSFIVAFTAYAMKGDDARAFAAGCDAYLTKPIDTRTLPATIADIDEALQHTLAACFDAGGISLGALYLKDGDGLRVLSFGLSRDWSERELLAFFGERALLDAAIASPRSTLIVPGGASPEAGLMLAAAGVGSVLIVPLAHKGLGFGGLVMLSHNGELRHDDRIKFGEAVAGQISQALAVTQAFREKERSTRAAREQAAILRSVVESIGDGIGVVDGSGQMILWNSAASDLMELGNPDEARSAGPGHGIFDSDTVTPVPSDRLPLVRAMRGESLDGVPLFVRHRRAPDGVWLSATARPWRDDQGTARGGVVVFRDVTRDRATQSQLMVSDRMASIGMLAAGVAHEINNPLAAVLLNLELAQRELGDRGAAGDGGGLDTVREMLEDARVAADRVRQIVRDLKVFARHEDAPAGAVDVRKVLESTLRMARNEIRHRARVVEDYVPVALVEGSESRLGQVFLNLVVNAAQAIPEGNAQDHVIRIAVYPGPGDRIVVSVSDTGVGIPAENLQHLFRPFFTTKGPGVGTGLGLAICHRIVIGLGGDIQVESELGRGTTVRVVLPAAPSTEPEGRKPVAVASRAVRRARILVIDDEPMVGRGIERLLAKEHDVVATVAATEALARLRAGETFDVILCDLMMPQMSGMELYAQLHARDPAHADRIIFLTGGAFTPAARAFLDEVPNQRVEKPFDAQHLRALVNDRVR